MRRRWMILAIAGVLLLSGCGAETGKQASELSADDSSELIGNVTNEDADEAIDDMSSEELPEPVNEEIMGWMLERNSILRDGQEIHTVPCPEYYYDDVEVAFTSDSSAYVCYFASEEHAVAVDYTHDGGVTWETTYVDNELLTGFGSIFLSFWDEMEGCLLYCSDAAMGQMTKVLYRSTDGGKTFETVHELTDEIKNYPTGLAFCERDRGLVVTQNHGDERYAFLTEDGGKTWTDYRVEVPNEDSYIYVDAKSIQKDAFTGAWELVLQGVSDDGYMIYCTSTDNWETWQIQ